MDKNTTKTIPKSRGEERMKIWNIFIAICLFGLYIWAMSINETLLSILIGILIIVFLFLDDLIYKPIELTGWTLDKQSLNQEEKK